MVWYDKDWSKRTQIDIIEDGGGTKANYSVMFDALYNGAILEDDSCNQILFRTAARYAGDHDRTYITGR